MNLLKTTLFGTLILLVAACGQGEKKSGSGEINALQQYSPQTGTARLTGHFEEIGDLRFTLFADKGRDTVQTFVAPGGQLDHQLEGIAVNEIYMLEIAGTNEDDRGAQLRWWYTLPVFIENGADLTLISRANEGTDVYIKPFVFSIEGGNEEQQFLEAWNDAYVYDDQMENRTSADFERINQEFIAKEGPLISNLYLISRQTDHRSRMDHYREVYEKAPDHVKASKYGIDLANRIYRISNFAKEINMGEVLASRTSQLHPFDPAAFADKSHLVLVFWASWEPTAVIQVPTIGELVKSTGKTDVEALYFSLDTKMSLWKPVNDDMGLPNSFMLRAEVRQQAIDQLYLTELPRYMIVTPDGSVVENDLSYEELEAAIRAL